MRKSGLPAGCSVRIDKPDLQCLIDRLVELGYRVVGPRVEESAIVLDNLTSIDDLPIGFSDEQEAGTYRLVKNGNRSYFDFVVGPHSLKDFLFPSQSTLLECRYESGRLVMAVPEEKIVPLAVVGARSCDLHALRAQDRVFLEDRFVNPVYEARRQGLFVVAVNCGRAAATCFCSSLNTVRRSPRILTSA